MRVFVDQSGAQLFVIGDDEWTEGDDEGAIVGGASGRAVSLPM